MNNEVEQLLINSHLRITQIRKAIISLFNDCRPLSAMEMLANIQELGFEPNKTTIYREIETLQKAGLIQPTSFDGKTVYELCSHHHHHLVCVNCKSVESISCENEKCKDNFSTNIKKFNFHIINSSVNLFGYCLNCKERK